MVEKIKMNVERLFLVLVIETNFLINLAKFDSKFWKQNPMYFGHKHVETKNQ